MSIELALLDCAPRLAQDLPLGFFGGKCFFRPGTNKITFQFAKQGKQGDDDLGVHVMLTDIQVLRKRLV